jgi:hypothetical protein
MALFIEFPVRLTNLSLECLSHALLVVRIMGTNASPR